MSMPFTTLALAFEVVPVVDMVRVDVTALSAGHARNAVVGREALLVAVIAVHRAVRVFSINNGVGMGTRFSMRMGMHTWHLHNRHDHCQRQYPRKNLLFHVDLLLKSIRNSQHKLFTLGINFPPCSPIPNKKQGALPFLPSPPRTKPVSRMALLRIDHRLTTSFLFRFLVALAKTASIPCPGVTRAEHSNAHKGFMNAQNRMQFFHGC